jgi:hypothetical protein
MKRMNKKLALHKETVRSLRDLDLLNAQGGLPNPTISGCDGQECTPRYTIGCTDGCAPFTDLC